MIALLLLGVAGIAQAEPGRCLTPEALDALQGHHPPLLAAMVQAPPRIGLPGRPAPPPPGSDKVIYGTPYENHRETANFTINWSDSTVSPATVQAAADALETAWTAFIEEQGWPAPVSSDTYRLWVLLDRSLGGTGYTTEYFTDLYPQGYPVVYLNPDYAGDTAFWSSLAAHELMHTIQFAMRDWSGSEGAEQSWYWEASATHASELADPTWDGHQYTSAWYAAQPALRYDSVEGSHQYGMFVLNAWLDERIGPDTMQAVWQAAADRPTDTWDTLIAETVGQSAGEVWARFSSAYGNNTLSESDLFVDVVEQGNLIDGASGTVGDLGTHYWRIPIDGFVFVAEGDVLLASPSGHVGTDQELWSSGLLSVTALSEGATYRLTVEETVYPSDSDAPEDSDPADDTSTGRTPEARGGCACSSTSAPRAGAGLLSLLLVAQVSSRRRERQGTRGHSSKGGISSPRISSSQSRLRCSRREKRSPWRR